MNRFTFNKLVTLDKRSVNQSFVKFKLGVRKAELTGFRLVKWILRRSFVKRAKKIAEKTDKEVKERLVRQRLMILLLHGKIRSSREIREIVNEEMKRKARVRSRL